MKRTEKTEKTEVASPTSNYLFRSSSMDSSFRLSLLSVLSAFSALSAQTPSANVQRFISVDDPVVALVHVRVVDGTGAAPAEDQTVVLSGGRIATVGPAASVKVPDGAKVMDLNGHTVIPGIVGLHDHTF